MKQIYSNMLRYVDQKLYESEKHKDLGEWL